MAVNKDRAWLLEQTMLANVLEFTKANPEEVIGMTAQQVWEHIKNKPITVEMWAQYITNTALEMALILRKLAELQEKLDGLLDEEGSGGEGVGTPGTTTLH